MSWWISSLALVPFVAAGACSPSAELGSEAERVDVRPRPEGPYSEHAKTFMRLVWSSVRGSRGAVSEAALGVAAGPADLRDVYRKVAPATVLIKTPTGYGTGVIVTPDGKILTNHHVVQGAALVDFVETVVVRLGRLNPNTGVMELVPDAYEAEVLVADPAVDLALVHMKAPPPDLPYRPLAGATPAPGMPVAAVGHASVGFLWAIKGGNVAAVGTLEGYSASLTGMACEASRAGPYEDCEERGRMLAAVAARLGASNSGQLIQSTVPIGRGDSGGPLVTMDGSIVGLTVLKRIIDDDQAQYHVSWDTVMRFVSSMPAAPERRYPDPWAMDDNRALADVDEDALPEVLVSAGAWSSFWSDFATLQLDLDQDSFVGLPVVPRVARVVAERRFDAELALVRVGGSLAALYDTDDDGRFDLLLVGRDLSGDGGPIAGDVESAYRLGADGAWITTPDLRSGPWLRPALFGAEERARLVALGGILAEAE